jgi:cytochrome c oxidase subunit 2
VLLGAIGAYRATAAGPERIVVSAAKFEFSATEIRVRKDRPVTLVLSSADFPHGFSIPDFGARVDLVPGKKVELTFTPDRTGRFISSATTSAAGARPRDRFLVVTSPASMT